jgi:hypothetical protein
MYKSSLRHIHDPVLSSLKMKGIRLLFYLYRINLPVFITEAESVYCAVRTGSLNQTDTVSS